MIGFLQWIGGLGGVGAVFAVLLFFVYRQTNKQMRDDRRYTEDRMTGILKDYNISVTENTKVLWELITWLRTKNNKH